MNVFDFIVETLQTLFLCIICIIKEVYYLVTPCAWRHKEVSGQTVLITGAGSGLGRGLSERFANLGCTLVLWDVDPHGNAETARLIEKSATAVHQYTVDLCSKQQIYETADHVRKDVGRIDILINNAGIVSGKNFLETPDTVIERTMAVNAMALFWVTKSFLPAMIEANTGHIVTISSVAGLFGGNHLVDYCSSKFAAYGFHEALEAELFANNYNINMTVVCPYYINTGMFAGVQSMISLMTPEDAISAIINSILSNKRRVIIPPIFVFLYMLKGMLPVECALMVAKLLRISTAMDDFVGRSNSPQ